MDRFYKIAFALVAGCTLFGYGALAVAGTSSAMAYQWPALLLLGVAGAGSLLLLFRRDPSSAPTVPALLFWIAAAYLATRAALSPAAYPARMDLVALAFVGLIYGLCSTVLSGARFRRAFVGLLLLLAVGNTALAAYQVFVDPGFHILPGWRRDLRGDYGGGFYNLHPHLAGFLEMVAPLPFALAVLGRPAPGARALLFVLGLICCAGVGLSRSRGGMISLAVALLVLGLLTFWLRRRLVASDSGGGRKLALVGGALAVICVLGAAAVWVGGRVERSEKGKLVGTGRSYYWRAAKDQFATSPVFGTGAQTYRYHYFRHRPKDLYRSAAVPDYVHNDYLQTLAEYGLVGLGLVGLVLAAHLARGARFLSAAPGGRGPPPEDTALCAGAVAGICGMATHSVIDFNMHLPANAAVAAFLLALLASRRITPGAAAGGGGDDPAWQWLPRLAPVAIAAGVFAATPSVFPAERALFRAERAISDGDDPTAIAALHESLAADPGNLSALHNLALLRFNKWYEPDLPAPVAISYVRQALEAYEEYLFHNDANFVPAVMAGRCEIILAAAERDAGKRQARFRRAESWLEAAARLAPESEEPPTWLGELNYVRALFAQLDGDIEAARAFAETARAFFREGHAKVARAIRAESEATAGIRRVTELLSQLAP